MVGHRRNFLLIFPEAIATTTIGYMDGLDLGNFHHQA